MNCPHCTTEMTMMGCRITGDPVHWCPACGGLKPCDTEFILPGNLKPFRPQQLPYPAPLEHSGRKLPFRPRQDPGISRNYDDELPRMGHYEFIRRSRG